MCVYIYIEIALNMTLLQTVNGSGQDPQLTYQWIASEQSRIHSVIES